MAGSWTRLLLIAAFSAAGTAALLPAVRRLAVRLDAIDRPRPGKAHTAPTPYLGGVAIAMVVPAVSLFLAEWGMDGALILACALSMGALGLADDIWNIRPALRVGGEAAARGQADQVTDTLAEGDFGRRLAPERPPGTETGGEVQDWGVEAGRVSRHPTVEGLSRLRGESDRQERGHGWAHAAPGLGSALAESRPWSRAACSSRRAASAASSLRMPSSRLSVSRSAPLVMARRQPRVMKVMSEAKWPVERM